MNDEDPTAAIDDPNDDPRLLVGRRVSIGGLAVEWEVPEARVAQAIALVWDRHSRRSVLPSDDDAPFSLRSDDEKESRAEAELHANPGTTGRTAIHRLG